MTNENNSQFMHFDVAIVGSGLAGMTAALHLAATHRVLLISKASLLESASAKAQGGIAAVLDEEDSIAAHLADTLEAGAGLCDPIAAREIIESGNESINWLIRLGVPFTADPNALRGFHLTREGGHSRRRVIHAADTTGLAVQSTLARAIRSDSRIRVLEHHIAIDLVTADHLAGTGEPRCLGLTVQDCTTGTVLTIAAAHTVLATGGAGQIYRHTSNPATATGDGIAMAWRAGCRVANMEFIQFHPTCMFHPAANSFLISEAVRGEGGLLKLPAAAGAAAGERFMLQHDPRAELASRDIVAKAIDFEMKNRHIDHVDLDISHKSPAFLRQHFPNIMDHCASLGIDISSQPIAVVPAAHYLCGGIVTDLMGRTDIRGLYAVGEAACTGLHGANRLASNSLLECLAIGRAAARYISLQPIVEPPPVAPWNECPIAGDGKETEITHHRNELRHLMSSHVGVVRTTNQLMHGRCRIQRLQADVEDYFLRRKRTRSLIELRNMVTVAVLIIDSALARHESRGSHYTADFPYRLPVGLPTILTPTPRLHAACPTAKLRHVPVSD